MKCKYLVLVLLMLPCLSGCSDADGVNGIFT